MSASLASPLRKVLHKVFSQIVLLKACKSSIDGSIGSTSPVHDRPIEASPRYLGVTRTRRNNVTTYWSEIVIGGKRVTRTRSIGRERTVYEYWGYPASGVGMHKLGQVHKERGGDLPIKALRAMQGATQLRDFARQREAEEWIVGCDCWGDLQDAPRTEATQTLR